MAIQTRLQEPGVAGFAHLRGKDRSDTIGAALVFACVFAHLVGHGAKLLADPDTLWHIETGAWIWREKRFPWTDPFSHTFAGHAWIAKEWLSQLLLFAAKSLAGWTGVVVLTAASMAALIGLCFSWFVGRCRTLLALVLALLVFVLLAPHALARPHVFAFLPLFIWTKSLIDAADSGRPPPLWLLPVIVLWANLHGSYPIAYPIAALLGFEAVLRASAGKRKEAIVGWGTFVALALAAGCVTPYGIHAFLLPFTMAEGHEAVPLILEWQPLDWAPVSLLARGIAILFLIGLVAGGWRNAIRVLLVALVAGLMLRHSRFLDVFAIVAPLAAAGPIAERFPDFAPRRDAPRWPVLERVGLACILAAAIATIALSSPAPGPKTHPVAALAAARQAGISGPVYNSYNLGGFMIAEGIPSFVDGRSDQLFLGGFLSRLSDLSEGDDPAAFMSFIAPYRVTWAILNLDAPEIRHFEKSPGWKALYRDGETAVFAKEMRGTLP